MIKGILGSFQVYGFILNFKDNYYRRGTGNYYYNYNNYLEKSDLTVVFGIDIAASCVPVMQAFYSDMFYYWPSFNSEPSYQ